jgi:hypothetical protein
VDRLTVVSALAVVALAAGCGASAPTAGPQRGVTVGDLQRKEYFYQGDFLGQTVTVSAKVAEVLGPQVFKLSGGNVGAEKLTVLTDQPVDVSKDEVVRVTGAVGQLHQSAPSEGVPYIQRDLYSTPETKPYLYHATVEPLPTDHHGNS